MRDIKQNTRKKTGLSSIIDFEPRIKILAVFFVLFAIVIVGKLFDLQVLKFGFYYALASDQHEIIENLFPDRGTIYIQDHANSLLDQEESLYPAAINKDYHLIYAQPRYLEKDPEEIADLLLPILEPEEEKQEKYREYLINKLAKKDDPYEPLKHKVEDSQQEMINSLNIKGINSAKETFRFYPEKNIGAQVLGYVSMADDSVRTGYYGIEGYFNDKLAGETGQVKSEKDIAGRLISVVDKDFIKAKNGADIVLTIDKTLQYEVCTKLAEHAEYVEADSGTAVVMDPLSGAILAMCTWPDFDPNSYNKVEDIAVYNNKAIFEAYEPGSIFKPVTMAAGLDLGVITPDTTYIDQGSEVIDDFKINNADKQAHGEKNMTNVLEESLNMGTIFVARKVGRENFKEYVENFGFGQKTGLMIDTEVAGDISSLSRRSEVYLATGSFGQGLTATPLQMVQAFAVIANGGKLIKPYIVEEIREPNGIISKHQPQPGKQVISSKTATLLTGMLVSVVKNGHADKAAVHGYYVAGKTGTAQIAEKGEYGQRTNHSFVGFAPIKDPKFVMIIKLEYPKKGSYSSSTAAPLFGKIAKFILDYYHVMPDAL